MLLHIVVNATPNKVVGLYGLDKSDPRHEFFPGLGGCFMDHLVDLVALNKPGVVCTSASHPARNHHPQRITMTIKTSIKWNGLSMVDNNLY